MQKSKTDAAVISKMTSRRETPFPKRKNGSTTASAVGPVFRGPLNYNIDVNSIDSGLSTLLEDEIIELNSSSSSSSCGVISLLDSTVTSISSSTSDQTVCPTVRTPSNETAVAKSQPSTTMAATGTPETPFVNTRRCTAVNSSTKKRLTPLPKITGQHADVTDVLRLYQTQAAAELSRLEASLVKWKMMHPISPLRTAQLKQVIAAATELLAGPASAFRQAVCEALGAASKTAEVDIARHLHALQAKVDGVYANFAQIPVRTLTMADASKLQPAGGGLAATGSVLPVRHSLSARSCPAQQTPSPTPAHVARRATPMSARSKIPVL